MVSRSDEKQPSAMSDWITIVFTLVWYASGVYLVVMVRRHGFQTGAAPSFGGAVALSALFLAVLVSVRMFADAVLRRIRAFREG